MRAGGEKVMTVLRFADFNALRALDYRFVAGAALLPG
jgi:hypothetical protein